MAAAEGKEMEAKAAVSAARVDSGAAPAGSATNKVAAAAAAVVGARAEEEAVGARAEARAVMAVGT